MSNEKQDKVEIEYPCPWDYKIIGTSENDMRTAVQACLDEALTEASGDREFELGTSRTSNGGKYVSLRLNLMVLDEAERNSIFSSLANRPEIRIVI
jgi:putative lipoic acid-binding regulatory protein